MKIGVSYGVLNTNQIKPEVNKHQILINMILNATEHPKAFFIRIYIAFRESVYI